MATKTIGATGRDFATLALWAAYAAALTLSAPEVGQCFNDATPSFSSTTLLTFGGWTGDSGTNTVTLTCGTGQSFRDNAGVLTNALRYNTANGVSIQYNVPGYGVQSTITGGHFIMDGLQINSVATGSQGVVNITGPSSAHRNCIIQGNSQSLSGIIEPQGSDDNHEITNCLIVQFRSGSGGGGSGDGIRATRNVQGTDITIFAPNTSDGNGVFCNHSTTGGVFKNVVVAGFAVDYTGTCGASSANNATDKSSFGGTNFGASGQVSLVPATEWQDPSSGSLDMRVKTTSVKLKDNGATAGASDDIAKQPRTVPYTIGCWEFVSAVPPSTAVLLINVVPG